MHTYISQHGGAGVPGAGGELAVGGVGVDPHHKWAVEDVPVRWLIAVLRFVVQRLRTVEVDGAEMQSYALSETVTPDQPAMALPAKAVAADSAARMASAAGPPTVTTVTTGDASVTTVREWAAPAWGTVSHARWIVHGGQGRSWAHPSPSRVRAEPDREPASPPNIYQILLYHDHRQPGAHKQTEIALILVNFVDIEYFRTVRLCGCFFFLAAGNNVLYIFFSNFEYDLIDLQLLTKLLGDHRQRDSP